MRCDACDVMLTQVADAFQNVFLQLSTAMDNWAAVNEFRSVVRRLGEFEARLPKHDSGGGAAAAADDDYHALEPRDPKGTLRADDLGIDLHKPTSSAWPRRWWGALTGTPAERLV
jgi:ABC-type uncharacterized transport system fused permease/ATPase subunit